LQLLNDHAACLSANRFADLTEAEAECPTCFLQCLSGVNNHLGCLNVQLGSCLAVDLLSGHAQWHNERSQALAARSAVLNLDDVFSHTALRLVVEVLNVQVCDLGQVGQRVDLHVRLGKGEGLKNGGS